MTSVYQEVGVVLRKFRQAMPAVAAGEERAQATELGSEGALLQEVRSIRRLLEKSTG